MAGLKLAKVRKTKEPDSETMVAVFQALRAQRVITSKSGTDRSVLRMVPPLCLNSGDVEADIAGLDQAFSQGVSGG